MDQYQIILGSREGENSLFQNHLQTSEPPLNKLSLKVLQVFLEVVIKVQFKNPADNFVMFLFYTKCVKLRTGGLIWPAV